MWYSEYICGLFYCIFKCGDKNFVTKDYLFVTLEDTRNGVGAYKKHTFLKEV